MELLPLATGACAASDRSVEGLGTLDREVFEAIAESPSPLLDAIMPRLTAAADHSKLWLAIAAALRRRARRRRQRGRGPRRASRWP